MAARLTRKRRRLYMVLAGVIALAAATALFLNAIDDSLEFFLSPTKVAEKSVPLDRLFRLGGMVEEGSVRKGSDGLVTHFRVTDYENSVDVVFDGEVPGLFREGQGVVAKGKLGADGVFQASEILAKHDENYMPPEVAEALKNAQPGKGSDSKDEDG